MANSRTWADRACDDLAELKIDRKLHRDDGQVSAAEDRQESKLLDQATYYAEGAALVEAQEHLADRQGPDYRMNTTLRSRYNDWRKLRHVEADRTEPRIANAA